MPNKINHLFRLLTAIILIIVPVVKSSAQSEYDALIKKGQMFAYGIQLNDAEKLFTEAINLSADKPDAYFNIAQIHLWEFLGTKNQDDYKIFMKWYDQALDKAESASDKNPDDYQITYLLGDTYMLRAMAEATDQSFLSAYFAIKSASNYYEKTLELNPEFYDAYRGLGEIHYFLDFVPGLIKWVVTLTGLEADKSKGFSELKIAYKKGSIDKIKSTLSLSEVYSDYVAEYDSAEVLLRDLVSKFPQNPMFNYHLAVVLIKKGNLNEADKYLDAVLELNNPKFTILNNFSIFLKGDISFKQNDFKNAIKYNKMFLEKTKDADYSGIANYRLAVSYKILGDTTMIEKCLLNTEKGNQDIYDDSFAKSRAEKFLKDGISSDEITMIKLRNKIAACKYQEVLTGLKLEIDKVKDINIKAKGLVLLSDAALHLKKYSTALRYAKQSDSLNANIETWVKPWSWYLISISSYQLNDFVSAKEYFQKAADSNEYEKNNIFYGMMNNFKRLLYK